MKVFHDHPDYAGRPYDVVFAIDHDFNVRQVEAFRVDTIHACNGDNHRWIPELGYTMAYYRNWEDAMGAAGRKALAEMENLRNCLNKLESRHYV